jgi:HopA1 effector protein family
MGSVNPRTEAERRPVPPAAVLPKPVQPGASRSGVVAAMAPQRSVLAQATQSLGMVNADFSNEVGDSPDRIYGIVRPPVEPLVFKSTPDATRKFIAEKYEVTPHVGYSEGSNRSLESSTPAKLQIRLPADVPAEKAVQAGFKVTYPNPVEYLFGAPYAVVEVPNTKDGAERWGELLNETGSTDKGLPIRHWFPGSLPQMSGAYFQAFFAERPIPGQPEGEEGKAYLRQLVAELNPGAAQSRRLQSELANSRTGILPGVALIPVSKEIADEYAALGVPTVVEPLSGRIKLALPDDATGGRIYASLVQRGFEGHGLSNPLSDEARKTLSKEFVQAYDHHATQQAWVTAAQIAQDLADVSHVFAQRGRSADRTAAPHPLEPVHSRSGTNTAAGIDPPKQPSKRSAADSPTFRFVNLDAHPRTGSKGLYADRGPVKPLQTAFNDLSEASGRYREDPSPRKETALRNELRAAERSLEQRGSGNTPADLRKFESLRNETLGALADKGLQRRSQEKWNAAGHDVKPAGKEARPSAAQPTEPLSPPQVQNQKREQQARIIHPVAPAPVAKIEPRSGVPDTDIRPKPNIPDTDIRPKSGVPVTDIRPKSVNDGEHLLQNSRESLSKFLDDILPDVDRLFEIAKKEKDLEKILYNIYNKPSQSNKFSETTAEKYRNDLITLRNDHINKGRKIIDQGDNLADALSNGFIHFQSERFNYKKVTQRIYLNTNVNHSTNIARLLLEEVLANPKKYPGVELVKVSGPEGATRRTENIVVYTHNEAASARVIARLNEYKKQHPESFKSEVPYFTKEVSKGISVGDQPRNPQQSFGEKRTDAIAKAIRETATVAELVERFESIVDGFLKKDGVNPVVPHLDKGSKNGN